VPPNLTSSPSETVVPLWLLIIVGACLPFTVYALWRIGRWWLRGEALPLPINGALPAVRWPAWFGLALFAGLFTLAIAVVSGYRAAAKAGLLPWEPLHVPEMFSPGVFLSQIIPPLAGLAALRMFGRGAAATAGVRAGRLGPGVLHGLGAFVVVLPICAAALWLNALVVVLLRMPLELHPLLQTLTHAREAWAMPLALVLASVLAPLAEEFVYRGVLLASLVKEVGAPAALAVSSVLFASAHLMAEPQAVLPLFFLGLALGYAAYRTRSLVAPILAHSLFNTVMILGAFFGPQ